MHINYAAANSFLAPSTHIDRGKGEPDPLNLGASEVTALPLNSISVSFEERCYTRLAV